MTTARACLSLLDRQSDRARASPSGQSEWDHIEGRAFCRRLKPWAALGTALGVSIPLGDQWQRQATVNGRLVAVALPAELLAVTEHSTLCPRSLRVTVRLACRPATPAFWTTTHRY